MKQLSTVIHIFLAKKLKISAPRCALCFFKKNQKSVPKECLIKRASIWPSEALRLSRFGL